MRRLDELLSHAAERGDRMGPDRLIEHLERRLAGEREVLVAAPPRRGAMVTTKEKPTPTTELPRRPTTRWAIALAGFAVAVVAVAGAVILFGGSGDDVASPETPSEVMASLATAVEQADPEQLADLSWATDSSGVGFLEWNLALGMNPVFSDCTAVGSPAVATQVTCSVTAGDEYFFSVVQGENLSSMVTVRIDDGVFDVTSWPAYPGLEAVEHDLRAWIQETHPELETQMFGNDYAGVVKFDKTAGELHTLYLDEYLAYRNANS